MSEVYSAPVLAALGADGRRAFAARVAGRTQAAQRIKVLDFQGVFVSGSRALAQVVYRLSTRAPSGRFVARAPAIWTVTLAREGGRWRFVRGIETLDDAIAATPATTSTAPAMRRAGTRSRPTIAAPAAAITTLVSRSAATGAASARSSAASTST